MSLSAYHLDPPFELSKEEKILKEELLKDDEVYHIDQIVREAYSSVDKVKVFDKQGKLVYSVACAIGQKFYIAELSQKAQLFMKKGSVKYFIK